MYSFSKIRNLIYSIILLFQLRFGSVSLICAFCVDGSCISGACFGAGGQVFRSALFIVEGQGELWSRLHNFYLDWIKKGGRWRVGSLLKERVLSQGGRVPAVILARFCSSYRHK